MTEQGGEGALVKRSAFTLIEMLVVVAVLGIAGAMIIPSMGSVGALRVQTALRTIVSDITFAQADAIAFQERRAVIFDQASNSYCVASVPGNSLSIDNALYYPAGPGGRYVVNMSEPRYAGAQLSTVTFGTSGAALIFDDLGSPVTSATDDTAGPGGSLFLSGSEQAYQIVIDAYTGRVSVHKQAAPEPIAITPIGM